MTFLADFNSFVNPILNYETWALIEMIFSVLAFFLTIWQRANMPTAMTNFRHISSIGVLISQFALYFQMIIFMIIMVDGYTTLINTEHQTHCLLILFVISVTTRKLGAYFSYNKIFNSERNLLTQ